MNSERDEQVDRLLHDAQHAEAGARFAKGIGHTAPAAEMAEKAKRLRSEASRLDPTHEAPAWAEDGAAGKRRP